MIRVSLPSWTSSSSSILQMPFCFSADTKMLPLPLIPLTGISKCAEPTVSLSCILPATSQPGLKGVPTLVATQGECPASINAISYIFEFLITLSTANKREHTNKAIVAMTAVDVSAFPRVDIPGGTEFDEPTCFGPDAPNAKRTPGRCRYQESYTKAGTKPVIVANAKGAGFTVNGMTNRVTATENARSPKTAWRAQFRSFQRPNPIHA